MAWVVDTCVLIDVLEDDPLFGRASASTLDANATDGLIVCPITFAELAPAFGGDSGLQEEFLSGIGADYRQDWSWETPFALTKPGMCSSSVGGPAFCPRDPWPIS